MKDISSGELLLNDFVDLVKLSMKQKKINETDKDWKDKITKLMKLNNSNEKQIKDRIRQLDIFLKMHKIKEIIAVLLEIKQQNSLTGDFQFLEKIANSVSKNTPGIIHAI